MSGIVGIAGRTSPFQQTATSTRELEVSGSWLERSPPSFLHCVSSCSLWPSCCEGQRCRGHERHRDELVRALPAQGEPLRRGARVDHLCNRPRVEAPPISEVELLERHHLLAQLL